MTDILLRLFNFRPPPALERTQAVGEKINGILDSYPEVKNYIGISGFSIMGGGEQSNSATYFVVLKNWSERKGKEHTAAAIVNRFNGEAYMTIQAGTVFAMVPPAIPGLGHPVVCSFSWKTGGIWDRRKCSRLSMPCLLLIIRNRL